MHEVPENLKTTALYEVLKEAGAHFAPYAGFYMPLYFKEGIVAEHLSVRNTVGFFDVSHMGEIVLRGKDASRFLNYVATNNIDKCNDGGMQYTIICNKDGGVIDDMMVCKYNSENILLVCNAVNTASLLKHFSEVLKQTEFEVSVSDQSDEYSALAVQGKDAQGVLEEILKHNLSDLKHWTFKHFNNLLISSSGYTGEKGYEVFGPHAEIVRLTEALLQKEVAPCGLGSRDTLRFEAGLPLFGHELSRDISPVQAGLNFALDFSKEDFIGKDALLRIKENLTTKIYGMELLDVGVARAGYEVVDGDEVVGRVTSGFIIPGTKKAYANALIENKYELGDELAVLIRNKKVKVTLRKRKYM